MSGPSDGVEGGLGLLTDAEKDAVRRAVRAVVDRDVATVATMLDDDGPVEDFWMWVDTHWPADTPTGEPRSPARLLMPPPPVEDWDGQVFRREPGGDTYVIIDFLDADDPARSTDLSLELTLVHAPDGSVRVEAEAPHVM